MITNVPGTSVPTMISPVQKTGSFSMNGMTGQRTVQNFVVQQATGQPQSQPIIIQGGQPGAPVQTPMQTFRMPVPQQVILNSTQIPGQAQSVIIPQQQQTQQSSHQIQMIPQVQVIQQQPSTAGAASAIQQIPNIPISTLQQPQIQQQQTQQLQRLSYPTNMAQSVQVAQVPQPAQQQIFQPGGQPQVIQSIGPNNQLIHIARNPTYIQQTASGVPQQVPQPVRMVPIPQPGNSAYQVQSSQMIISNPGQPQAHVQSIPGMNPMTMIQHPGITVVNGQPQPPTPTNDKILKGMNPQQQRSSPYVQLSNISKSLKGNKSSPYMNTKFASANAAAMNTITFHKESPSMKTGITAASPLANRPI